MGLGVGLTLALWFILRGDLFHVLPCVILFLCFSLLLPCFGKRELIIVLFVVVFSICACLILLVFSSFWCLGRAAVCDCGTLWTFLLSFELVWVCLFPLPLGVWEGLWLAIVAFLGLFSFLFFELCLLVLYGLKM